MLPLLGQLLLENYVVCVCLQVVLSAFIDPEGDLALLRQLLADVEEGPAEPRVLGHMSVEDLRGRLPRGATLHCFT